MSQWWQYIIDFVGPNHLPPGNFLAAFPKLATRLNSDKYTNDPDTEAAVRSLETSTAGFAIATGCPGAGKSTWATEVCDAVMDGPPSIRLLDPTALNLKEATETEAIAVAADDVDPAIREYPNLTDVSDSRDEGTWEGIPTQRQREDLHKLLHKQRIAAASRLRNEATARREKLRDDMAALSTDGNNDFDAAPEEDANINGNYNSNSGSTGDTAAPNDWASLQTFWPSATCMEHMGMDWHYQ